MRTRSESGMRTAVERADVRSMLAELEVPFRERAGEAWIRCPLHPDKTPSLHVGLRGFHKGDWRCFSCTEGGGLASLVAVLAPFRDEKVERDDGSHPLDTDRAWRWIQERTGVAVFVADAARDGIEVEPGPVEPKVVASRRLRLELPDHAPVTHPDARNYLASRFVPIEQAIRHHLGYVEALRRILVPSFVSGELAIYDLRAIDDVCPRCSRLQPHATGPRCTECGGKTTAVKPKTYGASRDLGARPTEALFGYDTVARFAPLVVVVEGPWGALAVERAGLPSIALRGSVLHDEQARLIAELDAARVVVVGDGDAAGSKLEGAAVALAWRCRSVGWVELPPGVQPDDLAPDRIRSAIESARAPRLADRPVAEGALPRPKR